MATKSASVLAGEFFPTTSAFGMAPKRPSSSGSVSTKTLTRMAGDGRLRAHRNGGGHRRYRRDDVDRLLQESGALDSPAGAREKASA